MFKSDGIPSTLYPNPLTKQSLEKPVIGREGEEKIIYNDEVVIGKKVILDYGATDKIIKNELYSSFLDGYENCVDEMISDMTESFSNPKQKEAFAKMIERDVQTYMKFLEIRQDTRDIEAYEDPHFLRVSFEAVFDLKKSMDKANKEFKKLDNSVSK